MMNPFTWFRRSRLNDVSDEIRSHIEEKTDEFVASGMSRADAELAARRAFGNVVKLQETARDVWRLAALIDSLATDVRYALRMLMKNSGFTLTAVITLALGIGATSVIFSFVNGILLRPLPYRDSDRLVLLDETAPKRGIASMGVSYPDFLDWREQNRVFTGVAAYEGGVDYTLSGSGEPEEVSCSWVSYNTFEILGVAPILGRSFTVEEERWKNGTVVILSHGLWARRFDAKPDVMGGKFLLSRGSHGVMGVRPRVFKFRAVCDLWVPAPPVVGERTDHGGSVIARLNPGVSVKQAQSDMSGVARHIEEQNPVT